MGATLATAVGYGLRISDEDELEYSVVFNVLDIQDYDKNYPRYDFERAIEKRYPDLVFESAYVRDWEDYYESVLFTRRTRTTEYDGIQSLNINKIQYVSLEEEDHLREVAEILGIENPEIGYFIVASYG